MATRLYLHATAAPSVSPGYAGWGDTGGAVRRTMAVARQNSSLTNFAPAEAVTTSNYNVLLAQFVSAPMTYAGTLSGTINGVARLLESSTNMNAYSQIVVKVVSGDGATLRGTAVTFTTSGGTEWPTTTAARRYLTLTQNRALTDVAYNAGDRLVVELGYCARNTSSTSFTGTMRFGDPTAGADMGLSESGTTDEVPWLEFSQDILFAGGAQTTACGVASATAAARSVAADPGTAPSSGTLTVRLLQGTRTVATRVIDVASLPTSFATLSYPLTMVERAMLQDVDAEPVSIEATASHSESVALDALGLDVWRAASGGPSNQSIGCGVAQVSAQARGVATTAGSTTAGLAIAIATASTRQAATATALVVTLARATVSGAPRSVTVALGTLTIGVARAAVTAAPRGVVSIAGGLTVPTNVAAANVTGQGVAATIGDTTVTADRASVVASARPVTTQAGAVVVTLPVATVAALGRGVTFAGTVSVALQRASVASSARGGMAVPGGLVMTLSRATATAAPRSVSTAVGAVQVTVGRAAVAVPARAVQSQATLFVSLGRALVLADARGLPFDVTVHLWARPFLTGTATRTPVLTAVLRAPGELVLLYPTARATPKLEPTSRATPVFTDTTLR